jgi:vacuolar protein sorting-associated protein 13A/C
MFEGLMHKLVERLLGDFTCKIEKENLSVAVWKGEVSVKTVDINPEILKKFHIPLRMVFGKIESLLLRVFLVD